MPPHDDCHEAIRWFGTSAGLYLGSVRSLFASEFTAEHNSVLEETIIGLKARGLSPVVVTGQAIFQQAEYLWGESNSKSLFGKPVASKLELELASDSVVIVKDVIAPSNEKQLWYFYNHLIYPRVAAGHSTVMVTPVSYEEFLRCGAACPDSEFRGRAVTWEKLFWLIEASMINLDLFRLMRQQGLKQNITCGCH